MDRVDSLQFRIWKLEATVARLDTASIHSQALAGVAFDKSNVQGYGLFGAVVVAVGYKLLDKFLFGKRRK